jgi:hypothetical protein
VSPCAPDGAFPYPLPALTAGWGRVFSGRSSSCQSRAQAATCAGLGVGVGLIVTIGEGLGWPMGLLGIATPLGTGEGSPMAILEQILRVVRRLRERLEIGFELVGEHNDTSA